jgi:hypothetical protein
MLLLLQSTGTAVAGTFEHLKHQLKHVAVAYVPSSRLLAATSTACLRMEWLLFYNPGGHHLPPWVLHANGCSST